MTNRPKQIGTWTETAVVRAARNLGFPNADRTAQKGQLDEGDIHLTPGLTAGVIVEVKGGETAMRASDPQIEKWLAETETERINHGAAVAFLVTKRKGVGADNASRWWAWWTCQDFINTLGIFGTPALPRPEAPLRTTLADSLALLRAAGYGEPIEKLGEAS